MARPCVFCEIVEGRTPHHLIYEDDLVMAFLDKYPLTKGHVLVVPKTHIPHIIDLDNPLYLRCMRLAKHLGECAMELFQPKRIGIVVTGFEIHHTHIHVVTLNRAYEVKLYELTRRFIHPPFSALAPIADQYRQALKERPFDGTA